MRGMPNRLGVTSWRNMLLKPRRFSNPVNVEVAAPFSASLVFCDSSGMRASLAGSVLSGSLAGGEERATAQPRSPFRHPRDLSPRHPRTCSWDLSLHGAGTDLRDEHGDEVRGTRDFARA